MKYIYGAYNGNGVYIGKSVCAVRIVTKKCKKFPPPPFFTKIFSLFTVS